MLKKIRTVLIVTERRADFSRFRPVIDLIKKEKKLKYILVVTGIHLLKNYGMTVNEIEEKYRIHKKFNMYSKTSSNNDDGATMVSALGVAIIELSKIIKKSNPDIILSGFDIAANFAATIVGAHMNIPVAHIQGGEVSGTIDESIRHAMSKFAHYHFVSNKDAKIRLIRMGEEKKNIFIVGCPSIEVLKSQKKIDKKYFLKKIGINIEKKFIIVIQHSVTSELENVSFQIRETVKALKKSGLITLFVSPNNDAGSTFILREIKKNKNFFHTPSLSLAEYKNLLENCFALIGNSSSGIHEASSFFKPVINLGTRQNGRLRSKNIIDCPHNFKKILKYLKLLNNHLFYKKIIKNLKNPYEIKNTSRKIVTLLKKIKITPNVLQKKITY